MIKILLIVWFLVFCMRMFTKVMALSMTEGEQTAKLLFGKIPTRMYVSSALYLVSWIIAIMTTLYQLFTMA